MNTCSRRFLALNCVLQGHSLLDACDGEITIAAEAFGVSSKKMERMLADLEVLRMRPSYFSQCSPLVKPLVNFFRSSDYAFIALPGVNPIYLSSFMVSDAAGEVDDQVRDLVIGSLIRDIAYVEKDSDIAIADGKLLLPQKYEDDLRDAMMHAYILCVFGPGFPERSAKALLKLAPRLTMEGYRNIPATVCCEVLEELIRNGLPPTDYSATVLHIPDLLPVYQATGTIMELSSQDDSILWMLDEADSIKVKVLPVSPTVVRELLVTSMFDLSNIDYVVGGANGGLHVKSGG